MLTIAALVPMRYHSQRVPGKNYRPLAGKPLYQHIIETLLAVSEITSIMVDTDSEPVMEGLRQNFPQVKIIQRPENLRAPEIPMNEILAYDGISTVNRGHEHHLAIKAFSTAERRPR